MDILTGFKKKQVRAMGLCMFGNKPSGSVKAEN